MVTIITQTKPCALLATPDDLSSIFTSKLKKSVLACSNSSERILIMDSTKTCLEAIHLTLIRLKRNTEVQYIYELSHAFHANLHYCKVWTEGQGRISFYVMVCKIC